MNIASLKSSPKLKELCTTTNLQTNASGCLRVGSHALETILFAFHQSLWKHHEMRFQEFCCILTVKRKNEMNIQTTVMSAPLFFARAAVVAIACSKYGYKANLVLEKLGQMNKLKQLD